MSMYLLEINSKIDLTFCEKKCSNDREKHLKFETEGQEIARFLRSQAQFFQTVKAHNNTIFETE